MTVVADVSAVVAWFTELNLTKSYENELRSQAIDWEALETLGSGLTKAETLTLLKTDLLISKLGDRLKVVAALLRLYAPKSQSSTRKEHVRSRVKRGESINESINPLHQRLGRVEARGGDEGRDGFRSAKLVARDDDRSVFFDNPCVEGVHDDAASTRRSRKSSWARPRWSVPPDSAGVAEDLDDTSDDQLLTAGMTGVVAQTFLSWSQHLKLVGFMLLVGIFFELSTWLVSSVYGTTMMLKCIIFCAGCTMANLVLSSTYCQQPSPRCSFRF